MWSCSHKNEKQKGDVAFKILLKDSNMVLKVGFIWGTFKNYEFYVLFIWLWGHDSEVVKFFYFYRAFDCKNNNITSFIAMYDDTDFTAVNQKVSNMKLKLWSLVDIFTFNSRFGTNLESSPGSTWFFFICIAWTSGYIGWLDKIFWVEMSLL